MAEVLYSATIPLNPITKKNSQQILQNKRSGKRWIGQSSAYRTYAQSAAWFLHGRPEINVPVNVKMLFYMKTNFAETKRKVDLSNLQSACLDILVDAGIIEDDNCNIVCAHDGSKVLFDKENPRTEIIIERITT